MTTQEMSDNGSSDSGVVKKDEPAQMLVRPDILATSWRGCCLTSMAPFAVYYGVVGLVTQAMSTYLSSQVTTIEKQFGMSSAQTGLLQSMNDAGFFITVIFVSYFGRNSHIPRIMGFCCFIYGVSALMCFIPYLFTDNSLHSVSSSNASTNVTSSDEGRLCSASILPPGTGECSSNQQNFYSAAKTVATALISCGMFIQGMAKSPRVPLVQTYVDDNVPKTSSGFYIGIILSMSVFGPASGFAIGGAISKIYVTLNETTLTPRDPRWVGAWWLGFLLFGCLGVILSFPVCLFPRRLSNAPTESNSKSSLSDQHIQGNLIQRALRSVKGLLPASWRLARNPVYVFYVIATGLRFLSIAAISVFRPKYMQVHYSVSIFKANMIAGFMTVSAVATAVFLSGIVARKLKLGLGGMLKMVIVSESASSIFFLIGLFLICPQPQIQEFDINGPSHPLAKVSTGNSSSCFAGCNCDPANFFPICGSNGVNYISPCHAGCKGKGSEGYVDCLCISNSTADPVSPNAIDATPGLCKSECPHYIAFAVIAFLSGFSSGLAGIPGALVPIRATESSDKSLAIGISSFISSLIGWFLGPIMMGYVIDSTCRLWSTSCSRKGSCEIYDLEDFRLKYHGIDSGLSLAYIFFYVLAYVSFVRGDKTDSITVDGKSQETEMHVNPPAVNPEA